MMTQLAGSTFIYSKQVHKDQQFIMSSLLDLGRCAACMLYVTLPQSQNVAGHLL